MAKTQPSDQKPTKAQVFRSRLFSTLLMWGVVTAAFVSGSPWLFGALIFGMGLASAIEYQMMLRHNEVPRQPFWGLFITIVYLAALWLLAGTQCFDSVGLVLLAGPVVAVIGTFIAVLKEEVKGRRTLTEIGTSLLGFAYLGWLFGMSFLVIFRDYSGASSAVPGAWLGLYLIAVTKFTDMGAYLTGSLIGKHKMIPHISPGKTWQGAIGALFFAQLIGCLLFVWQGEHLGALGSWPMVVGLNFALSVMAILGDLAGSVIKRALEVKDASHALPGIGGIFDLIDSICFTAPTLIVVLELVRWLS